MSWMDDCLAVLFTHQKNDQDGERPRDPRRIYANPVMPEICPILSLGMYFLVYNPTNMQVRLFSGNNQYERFRARFNRCIREDQEVIQAMLEAGQTAENLGTHSFRKGGTTYVSSGCVGGPSAAAIHL